jgi:hypothetical protein
MLTIGASTKRMAIFPFGPGQSFSSCELPP